MSGNIIGSNIFKRYILLVVIVMPKYIDQLSEDTPIPNQGWCCISFISPETLKNCNFRGIKVRGVYATKDEAEKRAAFLQQIDPDFNIYVGEVGKWLGWDPDPNSIDDQKYREKKLQDIMTNYKKNREKAKILEEERKRDMLEESVRNQASESSNTRDRLRRKAEKKRLDKKMKKVEEGRFKFGQVPDPASTSKDVEIKEKLVTAEKQRISNNEQVIKQSAADLSTVDDKLNELQNHYKMLLEKKKKQQLERGQQKMPNKSS
jgi:hypothetical protein